MVIPQHWTLIWFHFRDFELVNMTTVSHALPAAERQWEDILSLDPVAFGSCKISPGLLDSRLNTQIMATRIQQKASSALPDFLQFNDLASETAGGRVRSVFITGLRMVLACLKACVGLLGRYTSCLVVDRKSVQSQYQKHFNSFKQTPVNHVGSFVR